MAGESMFPKSRIARELVKYSFKTEGDLTSLIASLDTHTRSEIVLTALLEQIQMLRQELVVVQGCPKPDNIADGMLGAMQWHIKEQKEAEKRAVEAAEAAEEAARVAAEEARVAELKEAQQAEIDRRVEAGELLCHDYSQEVSVRGRKVLTRAGIVFISDISARSLFGVKNCGVVTFDELMDFRKRHLGE